MKQSKRFLSLLLCLLLIAALAACGKKQAEPSPADVAADFGGFREIGRYNLPATETPNMKTKRLPFLPLSLAVTVALAAGCASFEETLAKANAGDAAAQYRVAKAFAAGDADFGFRFLTATEGRSMHVALAVPRADIEAMAKLLVGAKEASGDDASFDFDDEDDEDDLDDED